MKENQKYKLGDKNGDRPSPFGVPEGYFDSLTDRIMEKVKEEEPERKVRIMQILRPQFALVAAILGFALISFTAVKLLTSGNNNAEFYDLATLEKMGYFYDESTLMELVPTENEEELTEDDLWVDDAIEYLADNDMSFYQLFDDIEY